MPVPPLAPATETGRLGACQLKRLWSRTLRRRAGQHDPDDGDDPFDHLVLHALGIGLEQGMGQLFATAPDFDAFERWIVETAGEPAAETIARLNATVTEAPVPPTTRAWLERIDALPDVLDAADLAHWDEHGYLILRDAIPADSRDAAAEAVWRHVGARPDEPDSWYGSRPQGVMVQYFQHPAFSANRRAERIHKAFAQLWGHADLWPSIDRVGFHPPERPGFRSQRPPLHWDVSLVAPIPFGTQGILYLTDTPPEQGALSLVPGFQRRIERWLADLPPGADPRRESFESQARPIGARAGDMVIWHQALPHGPGPNRGALPRLVQYLNLAPARPPKQAEWR